MAININYNLKISDIVPIITNVVQTYKNILTEVQIAEMQKGIEQGFVIENAYCKIDYLGGDKDLVEIRVGIYTNSLKDKIIKSNFYTFNPELESADNFIKQGYEYLKSLEEFAGAIDC